MNEEEILNKYFEENMSVSFDKFLENWEEQKEYTDYLQQKNKQLKKENEKLLKSYDRMYNINCKAREYIENNSYKTEWGDLEQDNESININDDITETEFIESLLGILRGDSNE